MRRDRSQYFHFMGLGCSLYFLMYRIGLFEGLLRCKFPAPEALPRVTHVQFDTAFLLNHLADGSPASKKKVHLQLLGTLVDDGALNAVLLGLA